MVLLCCSCKLLPQIKIFFMLVRTTLLAGGNRSRFRIPNLIIQTSPHRVSIKRELACGLKSLRVTPPNPPLIIINNNTLIVIIIIPPPVGSDLTFNHYCSTPLHGAFSLTTHIFSCSHWMYSVSRVLYSYIHTTCVCILQLQKFTLCHDINHLSDLLSMCRTGNLRDPSLCPSPPQAIKLQSRMSWATIATRVPTHSIIWAAVFSALVRPPHTAA